MSGAIPFDQIRDASLAQASRLLPDWFPAGKRVGREFKVGNIRGDAGESLSVNVDTGRWADFAAGQSGYDLIELRGAMRHGGDRTAAARELGELLGIIAVNGHDHHPPPHQERSKQVDEWKPIVPPPADAPKPADKQLRCDMLHEYCSADDRVLCYVRRFEAKGSKGKLFLPLTFGALNGERGWHDKAPDAPKPLYRLNALSHAPDSPVLLCEGEKAAEAAQRIFPDYVGMSWMGGARADANADLSPLKGRTVIIWPDADQVGRDAAARLAKRLPGARITDSAGLPDGFDAADLERLNVDPFAWLASRLPPPETDEDGDGNDERQDEAEEHAGWLTISDEPWVPDTLPPRPWLAPPYLMRGEITLLHGPGGCGKSQLIIAHAVALALGKQFGRLQPKQRCRVVLTNFEDNAVEQMRRISAALRYFGATPADLKGWLFRVSLGPKGDATMFELDEHGAVRPTRCWHALEHACETLGPDAVFLDPLVAINAVPESDNTLMRRVMTSLLMGVARLFNCALGIAHHDNKNGADDDDGDQGNARGAGDIVNAVRFEKAVKKMSATQADQIGVDAERRGYYFRLGSVGSKVNYAAPEDSEWFERLAVAINGEAVVRCIPWDLPSTRLTDAMAASLVAAIGDGTKHGPYSPQLGKGNRSLRPLLDDLGIKGAAPQRRAMHELTSRHGVVQAAWKIPGRGADSLQGLRTAAGFPANWGWLDEEEEGP